MHSRIPIIGALFLAFAAVSLAAGCGRRAAPAATGPVQLGPENYAVADRETLASGPVVSGSLVPREQAVLRAQVAGAVVALPVAQGEPVRPGQVLARIDPGSLTDAVTAARLAVTNAQTALEVARREQWRQETLFKADVGTQVAVDQARAATASARAGLSAARSQLANATKVLATATLRAPFTGIVSERNASEGDVVQVGAAVVTIVDPRSLELQGTIPSEAVGAVRIGMPVRFTVTGVPQQSFTATITRINPTADPATRQVRLYAALPRGARGLVGGLYVEGRVTSTARVGTSLPTDAIDRRLISPAVARVKLGVVERVPVTLGTLDEPRSLVEVLTGLAPGDTVLRGSAIEIPLGTRVTLLASPAGPTAQNVR